MTILWSLLSGIPGLLNGLLTYLNKVQDTSLEKFRIGTTSGKEVSIAVVEAQVAGVQAQKEMNVVGMGHPVWWIAWALFVIPVGMYHSAIFFVSTFHLQWVVDRVPQTQETWALYIVLSIFGAQVTTGLTQQITTAWLKK